MVGGPGLESLQAAPAKTGPPALPRRCSANHMGRSVERAVDPDESLLGLELEIGVRLTARRDLTSKFGLSALIPSGELGWPGNLRQLVGL